MFFSHVITLAVSSWGPRVTQPSVMIIKLTTRLKIISINWFQHEIIFYKL